MKNFGKALGKALLYFLVYFAMQLFISMAFSTVYSFQAAIKAAQNSSEIDIFALQEQIIQKTMNHATLMVLIANMLTILTIWLIFVIQKKKCTQEISLYKVNAVNLVPVVILGISFNFVITAMLAVTPFPQAWQDSYLTNSSSIMAGNPIVNILAAIIAAPIAEEIIFRGLMYSRLKKGMPMTAAAVLASLAFAIMHGTIIWGIYTFIFSLLLIWIYETFQSILPCIVLHTAFNTVSFLPFSELETSLTADLFITVAAVLLSVLSVLWIIRQQKVSFS